ncbi:acetylating acetaldehyde dehydrogenase [Kitasatospora sp. NPDC087314]|uniref:acetylating acetaldehyde dehydrogenase n=1 Tax=Kitasatospora sp. NPDC087314 TaxID=3364068 RepID=UPI00382FD651
MPVNNRLNVAVLGAGLIGIDLLDKIHRSPSLDCRLVVGRNTQTVGLTRAAEMGYPTTAGGIAALMESDTAFGMVFEASNADSHAEHWRHLEPTGATLVDLTPSNLGALTVPTVNGADALTEHHISLISCGGQAAIPVLHAIAQHRTPHYVEVVSTGASRSAGRATRLNLDEYIATTRDAVCVFTGTPRAKVLVNVTPATPPPPFRVTMTALAADIDPYTVHHLIAAAVDRVQAYLPGYSVARIEASPERVTATVEVIAPGHRLPAYAGNLEIINAAAIYLARMHADAQVSEGARP